MKRKSILGFEESDLIDLANSFGERSFRGKQLYRQIYRRKEFDFEKMTDLAKNFRERLIKEYCVELPKVSRKFESSDRTVKFLMELEAL